MSEKQSRLAMKPDEVRKLYCEEGFTQDDLCHMYQVSLNQLKNFLSMNEIRKNKAAPRRKLEPLPHQTIKTEYESGQSLEAIAEKYDSTPYQVRCSLENQGIAIRSQGWKRQTFSLTIGTVTMDLGTGVKEWYDVPGYEGLYKMSRELEMASFNRSAPRIIDGQIMDRNRTPPVHYYRLSKNGKLETHRADILELRVFGQRQEATG